MLPFLLVLLSAALQVLVARPLSSPSEDIHASPDISLPDYSLYHRKDDLLDEVRSIVSRHPDFMKIEERKGEIDGYSVTIPVVTIEPGGFTDEHADKLRILMSFGEHGREIITTELALKLLQCFESEALLGSCVTDADQLTEVQYILSNTILKIIPVENPNGRMKVEDGDLCERKNGRGVDINRNWDIDFGKKEKDYDPSEEYPGEHAFSEPETSILKDLAVEMNPHVWIAVHSGMCAVFMPYDHVGVMPTGESADAQFQILKTLKSEHLNDECAYGPGGKTVGYVAHGTGTDYMYSVLNVPLAFTWEIYGNATVDYADCFAMFNPTTEQVFQETLSMWLKVFFKLIQLLPSHPNTPNFTFSNQPEPNVPDHTTSETNQKIEREFEDGMIGESVRRPQTTEPVYLKTSSKQLVASFNYASVFGWALAVIGVAFTIRLACKRSRGGKTGRRAPTYRDGEYHYGLGYQ